jgi:hypothetical protein
MFETRVTVFPDVPVQPSGAGGFTPDSFTNMMHLEIEMPGLDRHWQHTLVAVTVAEDRNSAELTCHSTPKAPKSLDRGLRIVTWLPPAHIRAHDQDGTEVAVTKLDAPLPVGEFVEVGGVRHRVAAADWPHRNPDTGICHEGLDYQHVTLVPDPEPAHLPTLVSEERSR